MPYIDENKRLLLDTYRRVPDNAGELNYMVTRLVDGYLRFHGVRYGNINEAIGVLECAKLELYRRIAAPYEDTKIVANGDVYTCNQENK